MYAVIQDGGKQFKVTEGGLIDIELRPAKPGDTLEFDRVLFWSSGDACLVGAPCLENARVLGTVEREFKDKKVISYKFRRREPYQRKKGHRQRHLRVKITQIAVPQAQGAASSQEVSNGS